MPVSNKLPCSFESAANNNMRSKGFHFKAPISTKVSVQPFEEPTSRRKRIPRFYPKRNVESDGIHTLPSQD